VGSRFTTSRCTVTGLGRRRGSTSRFRAGATATSRRSSAFGSASRSGRARADLGCAPTGSADLAHCSRRAHLGSHADRAPGSAQRPVVGPAGLSRPARSDLGVARARAIPFSATAGAVLGRQQAGHPAGVDTCAVMGFARKRLQAAGF